MQGANLDPRLTRWLDRVRTHRTAIAMIAMAAMGAIGFAALHGMMRDIHLRDVRHALAAIGHERVAAALLLTLLSYLALTLYDWCALRLIGKALPWRTAALASFTSYALSNNLGFSLLTGGSARLRAYTAAGLEFGDVARITLIASVTFWSGVIVVSGIALLSASAPVPLGPIMVSGPVRLAAGGAVVGLFLLVLVARTAGWREIRAGRWAMPLPGAPLLLLQVGVAALDLASACAALIVLVPGATPAMFGAFFLSYALAILVTLATHVPGGIGVFEATILALTPAVPAHVVAALILYRIIYYLIPLVMAGGLMAAIEGHRLRHPVSAGLSALNSIAQAVGPPVIAAMVFGGGGILLFSGVTPGLGSRMDLLNGLLPLPFIETSHFAASLIGLLLLIVAPALQARLASGFQIARLLALLGALFSLLKGIDYEEAGALLLIAGFLQYCRPAFYRRAGIGTAPIGRWWWAAILIALAASSWVGLVAYRHVPYSNDLWWDFTWNGNAPRYLRALLGCLVLLAGFAIWRLLSAPAAVETQRDLPPDVAARAMQVATRTESMLAFTGDKSFIVSAAGDAFLIYGIQGRTWVIMGDPVGPVSAWPELLWEIRRRSDAVHGRLCLYQISAQMLPLLVDLGLTAIKYGEEAMVPLNHFSLDGPKAKPLRYALKKGASLGLSFDVVPAAEVPGIGPELEAISDAWLAHKKGGEKGFSVGRFSHEYMARYDCAVLRRGERIIAFANIWALPNREEMSIDLMRHYPDAPNGTMDFLIVHLIQLAAARGFKRFNLGMAPLSGLSGDRLAPRWSKLGAMIFARGERLYGFSGLRAFKAKFSPRWQPLYIGLSPSRSALRALADLVALIER